MIRDLLKLTLIGTVLFCAGFFLKSIGIAETIAVASEDNHLTLTLKDGLILHAWLSEATIDTTKEKSKSGLAILLPMMSLTYKSYEPFTERLHDIGYATLAFDMRGHGLSTKIGKDDISFSTMDEKQFGLMPEDIEAFVIDFKKNHSDQYDYNNVVIIGASIGANTAGILTAKDWVSRSVLLSPGKEYRGLEPGLVLHDAKTGLSKSIYIAAASDDTYSAESSQWLFDNYGGPKVFKKYPGQDHGTNILHNVENADNELLDWLGK